MSAFVAALLQAGFNALAGLITDILEKNPGISEAELVEKIKQAKAEGNAEKWLDDLQAEMLAKFKQG